MSHVGPKKSSTAIDSAYNHYILTGSSTLDSYI